MKELLQNAQKKEIDNTFSQVATNKKKPLGPAKLMSKLRKSSPHATFVELPGSEKSSSVISREYASSGNTCQMQNLEATQFHSGITYWDIFWDTICLGSFPKTVAYAFSGTRHAPHHL